MQAFRYRDRKYRATTQQMSITYFKLQENQVDFRVGVIGSRNIPYILNFCQSSMDITCTCPDFEKRQHKPLCKHMLFIVNLSNHQSMFNNLNTLNELKNTIKLSAIRSNLMAIIDLKKLNSELQESNTISIERDDFCSICMCDLDAQIEKCSVCAHVMHISCITGWWNLSTRWNNLKGKCPYCKDPRGFSHINHDAEDPWKTFDFSGGAEAEQQAPEDEQQAPEAEQQAPEAEQQAPEAEQQALEAEQDAQTTNWHNIFHRMLLFINRSRDLNINEEEIQNLNSHLESLYLANDTIQNAFQAQAQAQAQAQP